MKYYPIAINLMSKRAVVAGGGIVAEKKIALLITCGADIRVISPDLAPGLKSLAGSGAIRWIPRPVRRSDLRAADIVIAATSDKKVNKKVSAWAAKEGAIVNVVDNPALSDFISPAIFRTSKATIAVYTDGKDPALSRDLKNFLKENWDVFLSYRNRLQKRADKRP